MIKRYKKGGYRRHSYDVLDCYKLILKENYSVVKFTAPKQKKNECSDRQNDCYTVELTSRGSNSGLHFRVHIKENK